MNLEHIKRFIAVGQCLNFSKAADMLFISQPTLSHSIVSLEKELGTPLLVRNTRIVKLTRAGELFLPAAVDIMTRYQAAVDEISHQLNLKSAVLNVGYSGPALDNMLSSWVKTFCQAHPDVKVHIIRYATPEMVEVFENRSIHLGLLYKMTAAKIAGLKWQEVGREKFKILLNAGHPLANEPKITLDQIREEPFLICNHSSSPNYYDHVMSICERRGFRPNISQKVAQVSDIYRLVSAGLGVAIMSHSETRSYDSYDIKFVDIGGPEDEEDLDNSVVLAWMNNLSPLARQFKDTAKENSFC